MIYLVQKASTGKVKFLQYELLGNQIEKTWGLVHGKTQTKTSEYKVINAGKANELSPEKAAYEELKRVVETKVKEGYIVVPSLEDIPEFPDALIDLDVNYIPHELCLSKPTQKISLKALDALIKSGEAMQFVKYNGGCHYIRIGSDGKATIFTRRWDDHTTKYPKIAKAAESHNLPANSMIAVELCIDPNLELPHMVAFTKFAEIAKTSVSSGKCKADQSKAWALQEKTPVRAAVFAILYWNGEQAWHWLYKDMWPEIKRFATPLSKGQILFRPQGGPIAKEANASALLATAAKHKKNIEGFVVWDGKQAMEMTTNGKPARRASWKVKAYGEMDVIAVAGVEGKTPGQFGSLQICRMNEAGLPVDMGTVGGLKPKQGETDPANWTFPCVIEVTYDNIFPESGALQFGSFSKIHEDKQIKDVDLFSLAQ